MPSEKDIVDISIEHVVTQANDLLVSQADLSVHEMRILEACLSQVNSKATLDTNRTFTISVKDAQSLFYNEHDAKSAYRDLRYVAEKFFDRAALVQLKNGDIRKVHYVSAIDFLDSDKTLVLHFSPEIVPYISSLNNDFTSYKLKQTVGLTTATAHRLYHLATMWLYNDNGDIEKLPLIDFKRLLKVEGKYEGSFATFRKAIIEPALKEINALTDLNITLNWVKTGKKVTALNVSVFRDKAAQAELDAASEKAKNRDIEYQQKAEEKATKKAFNQEMKLQREATETKEQARKKRESLAAAFINLPDGTRFFRTTKSGEKVFFVKKGAFLEYEDNRASTVFGWEFAQECTRIVDDGDGEEWA